jgi:plastocyanin
MPQRWILSLFAVVALTGGGALPAAEAAASAQDASPAAGGCAAPALPPGTPTPMEEMTEPPAATPDDAMAGMTMGTPDAVGAAEEGAEIAEAAAGSAESTPEAGTPADQATADRVVAAFNNLAACLGGGDALGFAALLTPNYLQTEFGTDNPYDLELFLEGLPPISLESVADVQTHADGRLSADVVVRFGDIIERDRSYLVEAGEYLLLDEDVALPIEGADVEIEAQMVDYAFVLSEETVAAGQSVAFTAPNLGAYPHELVIVRLPEGVTVEQVLEDPSLEEQIEFVGFTFAEPGDTAYFGVDGLDAGTYTLVCFVDVPEGVPHVVRGMVAELTVE